MVGSNEMAVIESGLQSSSKFAFRFVLEPNVWLWLTPKDCTELVEPVERKLSEAVLEYTSVLRWLKRMSPSISKRPGAKRFLPLSHSALKLMLFEAVNPFEPPNPRGPPNPRSLTLLAAAIREIWLLSVKREMKSCAL